MYDLVLLSVIVTPFNAPLYSPFHFCEIDFGIVLHDARRGASFLQNQIRVVSSLLKISWKCYQAKNCKGITSKEIDSYLFLNKYLKLKKWKM